MELIQHFHFLRPAWLLALPLFWGLGMWLARRHNENGDWAGIVDPELLSGLLLDKGTQRRWTPWPWLAIAWTLAILALAGPSWQQEPSIAYRGNTAWALVLDLSPSMAATDLQPNRFTRARYALDDILNAAKDVRVGLVAFSEEPYTVTPMTEDVATIRALLPPLDPSIMPSAGDNLAPALIQAAKLAEQSGSTHSAIIVLTDGFADPAAAFDAAKKLKSQGMSVNVVKIGTAADVPLSQAGTGFTQNGQGQLKLARVDTQQLQQLASIGGGSYVDLAQLPILIHNLQTQAELTGKAKEEKNIKVENWLDGGIWLLPLLLLITALLTRRGWL